MIGKRSNTDADAAVEATETYVYDGNQIVLRFADDDAAALTLSDLKNRYLWGPAVDQILAEENVAWYYAPGTADWALSDHQNTVRDWVRSSGGTTTVVDHAQYDAFGNRLDAPAVDSLFGYTGRYHDDDTGLQWNGSDQGGGRWYDSATGRWLSKDRIGFNAGDPNLYRYAYNSSTIYVDPSGRFPVDDPAGQAWFAAHPIYWTNPNTGKKFRVPPSGLGVFNAPSYGRNGPPSFPQQWKWAYNNSPTAQTAAVVGITAAVVAGGFALFGVPSLGWINVGSWSGNLHFAVTVEGTTLGAVGDVGAMTVIPHAGAWSWVPWASVPAPFWNPGFAATAAAEETAVYNCFSVVIHSIIKF
ncbi:MAG: RHS repeat-associated core domain-containing protein [Pirellulales bacterium]|nr:RHS repeat-associated core domain-containing protein [Pirellulales bacterium]